MLCYYSTTAAARTGHLLVIHGYPDRVESSARFPSHTVFAVAPGCAGESRGKFPDCRALLRPRSLDGLGPPAPALGTLWYYPGILSRVVAGDGDHYGSQGTSQSRMKGRDVAFVALNLYGYPHSTRGGTCKGCKRGLRYIDIGIEYPLSYCQRRRGGARMNIVGRTSGHQRW